MTYEHSFADSQWRSGPQPGAIVNWPLIEKEDTMTDEPSLPVMTDRADRIIGVEMVPDLSTFSLWLKLQPISTRVFILHAVAADLFAEGWGGVAFEVRAAADTLKTLTRHLP